MFRFAFTSGFVVLCIFAQSNAAATEDTARMKKRLARYEKDAKNYTFYKTGLAESEENRLRLHDRPLMSYFNSSTATPGHTHQGAFFVWTHLGRPEIIAAIWSMGPEVGNHGIRHEFHSLSPKALGPTQLGRSIWKPSRGIQFRPIPGASKISPRKTIRLAQMRELSRGFVGFTSQPRTDGKEWKMRTEAQPMYRYESKELEVLDGGIFPIFADWDPDILLLIEARKAEQDYAWFYSAVRFNSCPLRLEYKNKEVWKAEPCGFGEPSNTYFMVGGGEISPG